MTLYTVAAFADMTMDADHFDGASVSGFSVLGDHFSTLEK